MGMIIILSAWSGLKTDYSAWQLKQKQGQTRSLKAKLDLDRLTYKSAFLSWQVAGLIFLYVGLFVSAERAVGGVEAWVAVLLCMVFGNMLAKLKPIQRLSQTIYLKIEKYLIALQKPWHRLANFTNLSSLKQLGGGERDNVGSIEELLFLMENSPSVVDDSQRRLIKSALKFSEVVLSEVMTPIDEVVSLAASDLIGPLVLDDLHRTGHDYFPVLNQVDEVVGLLSLADLVSLDNKTSRTAQELCDENVIQLRDDESLMGALQQLLTEQVLVAVVVRRGKTVGLVRLSSIIASLIGDKI